MRVKPRTGYILTVFAILIILFASGCFQGEDDDDDDDDSAGPGGGGGGGGGSGDDDCNWMYAVGTGIMVLQTEMWEDITPVIFASDWTLHDINYPVCSEGFAIGRDESSKQGIILHNVKDSWAITSLDVNSTDWELFAIDMVSPGKGIAVGADWENGSGIILMRQDLDWVQVDTPLISTDWWLTGVTFSNDDVALAVGINWADQGAIILEYRNKKWEQLQAPGIAKTYGLYDIHMTDQDNGMIVGVDLGIYTGGIITITEGEWGVGTPLSLSGDWDLTGVGSANEESWAVGRDFENTSGIIINTGLTNFTALTSPFISDRWALDSVAFSDEGQAFAVGTDYDNGTGVILTVKEDSWTLLTRTEPSLNRIRGF